jgi:NADH:ubiquinone oxidoreductase subunit 6 (subunit J)
MNAALILIAIVTVGTAVAALAGRNLLHSVLLLAASWTGVAAFYLWAGAQFVAFAQVLIYLGAISMVVLFAVLLTRRAREETVAGADLKNRTFFSILAGTAVAVVLLAAGASAPLAAPPGPAPEATVRDLGVLLMGPNAAALLVAGVLLTIALIGAVVLAAGSGPDEGEDSP